LLQKPKMVSHLGNRLTRVKHGKIDIKAVMTMIYMYNKKLILLLHLNLNFVLLQNVVLRIWFSLVHFREHVSLCPQYVVICYDLQLMWYKFKYCISGCRCLFHRSLLFSVSIMIIIVCRYLQCLVVSRTTVIVAQEFYYNSVNFC